MKSLRLCVPPSAPDIIFRHGATLPPSVRFCDFNSKMKMAPIRYLPFSLIQNRFLNTATPSSTPSSSSPSFAVQFLTNQCGLPLRSAVSASRNLHLREDKLPKLQSLLEFFKSHGFSDTHIAKLIQKQPKVLRCRLEQNLKPKFDLLISNGFTGQLLPELILSNPSILQTALKDRLKPCFEFLKTFLGGNEKIVAAVKHSSWLLMNDLKEILQPNMDHLVKEGVPVDRVAKFLVLQPRALMLKHDKMVYAVDAVKNLGIEPNIPMFIHAVSVMLLMTESSWKRKIELMRSLGWKDEEILWAFKRCPYLLASSEERMRSTTDFLINKVNLGLQTLIRQPVLLTFSIDKRLRPRYNVFNVLLSKKLIKGDKRIAKLLQISEKDFLNNYVIKYVDKVPDLLEIYGVPPKRK